MEHGEQNVKEAVEVEIEDQIRAIIEENESIWIIAMKCFELGRCN